MSKTSVVAIRLSRSVDIMYWAMVGKRKAKVLLLVLKLWESGPRRRSIGLHHKQSGHIVRNSAKRQLWYHSWVPHPRNLGIVDRRCRACIKTIKEEKELSSANRRRNCPGWWLPCDGKEKWRLGRLRDKLAISTSGSSAMAIGVVTLGLAVRIATSILGATLS